MRQLRAFIKKEFTEQYRSGKLIILGMIFLLFGIMNPAMAKLTPKLLEYLSKQDASVVVSINKEVTALDSWDQFFKNISTALIVFVIMQSGIFTKEYSSGTLLLSLTKGLERRKVVIAKLFTLCAVWTLCFWLCFGVTYGYNQYFWDNSAVPDLLTAALMWWVYGVFYIALIVFFSTFLSAATAVIACVGAIYLSYDLLGLIPKVGKYLPTYLSSAGDLTHGKELSLTAPLIAAVAVMILLIAASIPIFNKRSI